MGNTRVRTSAVPASLSRHERACRVMRRPRRGQGLLASPDAKDAACSRKAGTEFAVHQNSNPPKARKGKPATPSPRLDEAIVNSTPYIADVAPPASRIVGPLIGRRSRGTQADVS